MILKLGTSKNSYRLIPNVSSFEYTDKAIPSWDEPFEAFDEFLQRITLRGSQDCARKVHGFDIFDEKPIFPDFDPDNDKSVVEYHKDDKANYLVRRLSFIVNNTYMVIYTPFVCYVCNDDGKTFETLR